VNRNKYLTKIQKYHFLFIWISLKMESFLSAYSTFSLDLAEDFEAFFSGEFSMTLERFPESSEGFYLSVLVFLICFFFC
jgi:hypothetical protein